MNPLSITHRETPAGPLLRLSGDLDFHQAPELREQVDQLRLISGQCLVIDLSGLRFCDSSGITVFLAARQRALDAGADVALSAVPANLLRVLTLVGLDQVFTLLPDSGTPA